MKKVLLGLLLISAIAQAKWIEEETINSFGEKTGFMIEKCVSQDNNFTMTIDNHNLDSIVIKSPMFYQIKEIPNAYIRFNKENKNDICILNVINKFNDDIGNGYIRIRINSNPYILTNFQKNIEQEKDIEIAFEFNKKNVCKTVFNNSNSKIVKSSVLCVVEKYNAIKREKELLSLNK